MRVKRIAILDEFAPFWHHRKIVVSLLAIHGFVVQILVICLSDHSLGWEAFHKMIRRICDLLVVESKKLVLLIRNIHVRKPRFYSLNCRRVDGIRFSERMHSANVSSNVVSSFSVCSLILRGGILYRSVESTLRILNWLGILNLLRISVLASVVDIWRHLASFLYKRPESLPNRKLLNFFLWSLGHVDLLLQISILTQIHLLLVQSFQNTHAKFWRFFELSFLAPFILFFAPVVPNRFISIFDVARNLAFSVSLLRSVQSDWGLLSWLFFLLLEDILSWHCFESWGVTLLGRKF